MLHYLLKIFENAAADALLLCASQMGEKIREITQRLGQAAVCSCLTHGGVNTSKSLWTILPDTKHCQDSTYDCNLYALLQSHVRELLKCEPTFSVPQGCTGICVAFAGQFMTDWTTQTGEDVHLVVEMCELVSVLLYSVPAVANPGTRFPTKLCSKG